MIDQFTLKLILSFIVGGGYAIAATVAADKFGSKIGGLIGGLPSTVLFGLLFIAWTQNPQAAVDATTLIPAVIGIACFFLIAFVLSLKKGIWFALFMAYLVWFVCTIPLLVYPNVSFLISNLIFCLCFIITYVFVTNIYKLKSVKGNKIAYTPQLLLFRGFLTGFVVAVSVLLAKIGGPLVGGVFTTFPTLFPSILLLAYFSHGSAFSLGVAKGSLFGWVSTTIFVIMARYTFVPFGILGGTVISLALSYICAYLIYTFVQTKHS